MVPDGSTGGGSGCDDFLTLSSYASVNPLFLMYEATASLTFVISSIVFDFTALSILPRKLRRG